MKTSSDRTRQAKTPDTKPNATSTEASGRRKTSATQSTAAKPAKPVAATWPFVPGSQGDKTPLETKPVQRAGWNARQFRI